MKLGLIGLPQSGKTTVFKALTGARGERDEGGLSRTESRIAVIKVMDPRLDYLRDLFQPKKTTNAKIEYLLPPDRSSSGDKPEAGTWAEVRTCDALLHVVRNFQPPGGSPPTPEKDFWTLEEEMILSDLAVAEKRIERIEADRKKGKPAEKGEYELLNSCKEVLYAGEPLRNYLELAGDPMLRGFTFLSAKPMLVIVNNDDEDEKIPSWHKRPQNADLIVLRGRLEMDIVSMTLEESKEFKEAYNIEDSALDRVIRLSYRILDRISFFTVVSDELRAWSIPAGTRAPGAAGAVHSDMEKGFIKAEVLSMEDLKKHGSFKEARKAGRVRLEGKDYEVSDGDIINFRFNV